MQDNEDVVKNVKQFVTKFENSRQTLQKTTSQQVEVPKNKKVTALRRSIETSLHREFQPQRFVPSCGRPLAEVKNELCKSMDLSQDTKVTFQNFASSSRHNFARFNSTELLSNVQDKNETLTGRFYPVPAPRARKTNIGADRRYKSSSDLATDADSSVISDESFIVADRRGTTLRENENGLEQILERSGLSSNLSCSEDQLNTAFESVEDETTENAVDRSDVAVSNSTSKNDATSREIDDDDRSTSNLEVATSGDPNEEVAPKNCKPKKRTSSNSSKYFCRLNQKDWVDVILSVFGDKEVQFIVRANKQGVLCEDHSKLNSQQFNWDSIADVLILDGSEVTTSSTAFQHRNEPSSCSEKHIKSSLNDVERDLSSLLATEGSLLKKMRDHDLNQTMIAKFDSLLKDLDNAINLLFLLNRRLQLCEESSRRIHSSQQERLAEAKEIKKSIDLKCQRLFSKLETSIPGDIFDECLRVLTAKLSLKLKKECLAFKQSSLNKILKSQENTKSYSTVV